MKFLAAPLLAGLTFAAIGSAQAAEPGWCSALAEKDPRAAFGLIAEFSLQLADQKRNGAIDQDAFEETHLGIRDANLNFAKGEFDAGCEIIEDLKEKRGFELEFDRP